MTYFDLLRIRAGVTRLLSEAGVWMFEDYEIEPATGMIAFGSHRFYCANTVGWISRLCNVEGAD